MKENISLKSLVSLISLSPISVCLLYQSKVPKLQLLLVLFTLPLGLSGAAVRGVKVFSGMAITSTLESALKLTVFPQTFSSTLQPGSCDWIQKESKGKKPKAHWSKCLLSMLPLCDRSQYFHMLVAFGCCSWAITLTSAILWGKGMNLAWNIPCNLFNCKSSQ